jgi:ribosomal protein S18 acetylase RimI-like enzyme
MIRHAKILELPEIIGLSRACADYMIQNGIFQWNSHYPSEGIFKNDIHRKELYVLVDNSLIVACIAISNFMDVEYAPVKWLTPNKKNIYIHRLAVHPEHQRKGYARQLMDFAETYARDNKFNSIRLDTFSKNERNQKFYETRGYQKLEEIYFPNQSADPFYCYELVF